MTTQQTPRTSSRHSHVPAGAVVAAIGHDGHDAVVAYAAAQARREHRPLHLLHVLEVPTSEISAGVYGSAHDELLVSGSQLLHEAADAAHARGGADLPVTTELVDTGLVAHDVVTHAEPAHVLVLQHRGLGRLRRLVSWSVVNAVASRSEVPTVSVPEDWTPRPAPGHVVVAVQDLREAERLLTAGLEEARSRGVRLEVVHAVPQLSGLAGHDVQAWEADQVSRARGELSALGDRVRATDPAWARVAVTVRVEVRDADELVLAAAQDSDLVVVGRRHHRLPLRSHLGPVARSLLARAGVPVLVAAEPDAGRRGGSKDSPREDREH